MYELCMYVIVPLQLPWLQMSINGLILHWIDFVCLFAFAFLSSSMGQLIVVLLFLIEHFDKGARHQALHQTLLTVHVILIDWRAFGNKDDLRKWRINIKMGYISMYTLYMIGCSPRWRSDSIRCDPWHRKNTGLVHAAFDRCSRSMAWTDWLFVDCYCQDCVLQRPCRRRHWTWWHPADQSVYRASGLPSWWKTQRQRVEWMKLMLEVGSFG